VVYLCRLLKDERAVKQKRQEDVKEKGRVQCLSLQYPFLFLFQYLHCKFTPSGTTDSLLKNYTEGLLNIFYTLVAMKSETLMQTTQIPYY